MGFVSVTGGLGSFNFYLGPARDYLPLNWNRTHTFTQSFVYELPIGRAKVVLQNSPAAAILCGWQLSGVLAADTGTPLFITASTSQLYAPGSTQVPNRIKPFHRLHGIGTAQHWFGTTSFVAPTGGVLMNLGKNVYSGPGFVTFGSAFARTVPIRE